MGIGDSDPCCVCVSGPPRIGWLAEGLGDLSKSPVLHTTLLLLYPNHYILYRPIKSSAEPHFLSQMQFSWEPLLLRNFQSLLHCVVGRQC
jgi:hypothetical protein